MDAIEVERIVRADLDHLYRWIAPPLPYNPERTKHTTLQRWPSIRDWNVRKEGDEWVMAGIMDVVVLGTSFEDRRWPFSGRKLDTFEHVQSTKPFEYRVDDTGRITGIDYNMSGWRGGKYQR